VTDLVVAQIAATKASSGIAATRFAHLAMPKAHRLT
jgi:hypothetical protein